MKKLKHSKYKNTGILFEMLVQKLTSETLSSNKSITIDIIKKYFGKNTELSKELQLYNALIKEQHKTEARALDFIRTVKDTHKKLNQTVLTRQKYNLVKEISENFVFENMSKIHIGNYKALASIYMLFEYDETDNPKQIMECKNVILENVLLHDRNKSTKDPILDESGERIYEDATCGAKIEHQLAITEVQVKIQDREDKIMVSDSIGIKLKDIRYSDYRNLKTDEMDRTIENNLKLLTKYIDVIFDNDKVYSDFTEKELLEFIDQLQMKDLEKIYEYIEKAPRLEHTIEMVCPVCGHKETIKLQGLDDFLM
jgi:hypothetical protein